MDVGLYKNLKFRGMKVDWQIELMYIPFTPKEPISSFAWQGGSIFMSKKKPLLIVCNLATERETEIALKAQYTFKDAPVSTLRGLPSVEQGKENDTEMLLMA